MKKRDEAFMQLLADAYRLHRSSTVVAHMYRTAPGTVLRAARDRGIYVPAPGESKRGVAWTTERRAKTPPKRKRRSKSEWMADNIGKKGLSSHGYIRVNAGLGKRVYEHILIAERALGRKLKPNERVHHINCDPSDNSPTNLLVCSHAYHLKLHARMRRHPYWKQFTKKKSAMPEVPAAHQVAQLTGEVHE